MNKNQNRPRTWLAAFLIAFAALLLAIVPMSARVAAPQGKGGEVVAKPTPTPKKTTPKRTTPARTTNNSKTNQATKSASEAASAAEMIFWNSIKDSANPDDYNEYLKKYPNGEFSGLARSRLSALETAKAEAARKEEDARNRPPRGASVRNQIAMEFVWIPPGTFTMGSKNGRTNELPVHQVTFKQGFYMGRYEVTRPQWQALMGKDPSAFLCEGVCPVTDVNWDDTQKFIQKLNQLNDGFVYRLPSEAEWEYAGRAGTRTEFSFGDSLSSDQANFKGDHPYGGAAKGVDRGRPAAVGSYPPNAFGLYDMHGNVSEWCQDWYRVYDTSAPTDGSAWLSGGSQTHRVVRGGGWNDWAESLRSAYRFGMLPDNAFFARGFRVVAVPRTQ
jgi:formylglycine-generating enzyme required for sulfatase activity